MSLLDAAIPTSREFKRERPSVPPLENGDRLSRAEFERRYENMPLLKKAELIKGVVLMGSPVRYVQHGRPHALAVGWLAYYAGRTAGVEVGDNTTLRLGEEDEPQPDLLLRIPEDRCGLSRVDADGYLRGPVEFIFEVAASSANVDSHDKRDVYAAAGVPEYVIWRVEDGAVDFLRLGKAARYEAASPDAAGLFQSQIFPGLWLDSAALLRADLPRLLAAVDAGTATAEHAEFVRRLAKG
jgi:Uma2 family endonuclease